MAKSRSQRAGAAAYRDAVVRGLTREQAKAASRAARAREAERSRKDPRMQLDVFAGENARLRQERDALLEAVAELMGVSLTAAWQIVRLDLPGRAQPVAPRAPVDLDRF